MNVIWQRGEEKEESKNEQSCWLCYSVVGLRAGAGRSRESTNPTEESIKAGADYHVNDGRGGCGRAALFSHNPP